jgi:hypothetical protein
MRLIVSLLLMLLALAACAFNDSAAPAPTANGAPNATASTGGGGACTLVNNSGAELEVNSPEDIGTIIGLVAAGERIAVDGLVPADDSDEIEWIVITTADAGEGYVDPANVTLEGDCAALMQTAG